MTHPTCETCRFRGPGPEIRKEFECHRYPPQFGSEDDDCWPMVCINDWCGEHQPKAHEGAPSRSVDAEQMEEILTRMSILGSEAIAHLPPGSITPGLPGKFWPGSISPQSAEDTMSLAEQWADLEEQNREIERTLACGQNADQQVNYRDSCLSSYLQDGGDPNGHNDNITTGVS